MNDVVLLIVLLITAAPVIITGRFWRFGRIRILHFTAKCLIYFITYFADTIFTFLQSWLAIVVTIPVVIVSQSAGLVILLLMMPFLAASTPGRADLLWGAIAGLAGGSGVALLYRALAIGVMAVVAPTTAVCAVVVPVLVAIALGERPELMTIGGIALAMLIGNVLIYVPGLAWLHQLIASGSLPFDPATYASAWDQTLAWGLTPYLMGDALKLALAALIVPGLWKLIGAARA